MLRFVGGYQLDRDGNSVGVQLTDTEIALKLAQERQPVGNVAASVAIIERVDAAMAAGEKISVADLSRDSWLGQRNGHPFAVQVVDCPVNGTIEVGDTSEGLMSQVVGLQVVPDDLNVV